MTSTHPHRIEMPSIQQPEAWEDPLLFHTMETPDMDARWLPSPLAEFAAALAFTTETPEALSIMTVLGVISTVCTQRVVVSPKEGWQEPINIYTLIALPPANHKSWVLRRCTEPLVHWEKQRQLELEGTIKRQRSERKTQEKIIDALRLKAAKAPNSLLQHQLMQEIIEKEKTLTEVSTLPVLFTNDATPESLTALVHAQGGRLAIFSDEGGILETLAGLYTSGSANMDILLKGIDGGEIRVERKDRHLTLNPYLTLVFTVQPTVIQALGEKKAYLGNGALDRFLYVLPQSKLGYRTHQNPPIPTPIQEAYHAKISTLLQRFCGPSKTMEVLTLSPLAHEAWHQFQTTLEIELRPEGKLAGCLGWGGKLCGFVLRIAGLLHLTENDAHHTTIQISTMQNALALGNALIGHALAAFGLVGTHQNMEDAKILYQWIYNRKSLSFTQSEVTFGLRNRKLISERLTKALHLLQEHHIITGPVKLPTRKPTTLYHVNPKLFLS